MNGKSLARVTGRQTFTATTVAARLDERQCAAFDLPAAAILDDERNFQTFAIVKIDALSFKLLPDRVARSRTISEFNHCAFGHRCSM
jgi:hypothetical protein